MRNTSKKNTKNGLSPIINISSKEIKSLIQKKNKPEEPDFTLADKEWIKRIDAKDLTIEDIL